MAEDGPSGKPPGPDDEPEEAEPAEALDALAPPSLDDVIEAPPGSGPAEEFHRRARLAEDRLAEVLAAYRKLKAETDAHRERVTRNLERKYQQRHEALLLNFMGILDNLDRALDAAETSYGGQPLIEGLILVRTQLVQTLQEEGLERIPVLGLPYDPHVSEVVATTPVADPDHHHVVMKEMLRGYRISGRVARASQVVVGEYKAAEAAAQPAPAPSPAAAPAAIDFAHARPSSPTAKTQRIPIISVPAIIDAPAATPPASPASEPPDEDA